MKLLRRQDVAVKESYATLNWSNMSACTCQHGRVTDHALVAHHHAAAMRPKADTLPTLLMAPAAETAPAGRG